MISFWDRVNTTGDCWEWTGSIINSGYGKLGDRLAHRISWSQTHGDIPKGMCICHSCDNKLCVNPDHLFLGSYQDNTDDMQRKGRHRHGETHHRAKLTEVQVGEIRSSDDSVKELGVRFGVHPEHIRHVRKGERRAA